MNASKVLSVVFPNEFTYDEKHNDFFAKMKIDIMSYPFNLRQLFYMLYPKTRDSSKEFSITRTELNNLMDTDPEVQYIENPEEFSEESLKHLIKDDFEYLALDNDQDRKFYEMNYIVKYSKNVLGTDSNTWNFEYLFEKQLYPISERFDKIKLTKYGSYRFIEFLRKNSKLSLDGTISRILIMRFHYQFSKDSNKTLKGMFEDLTMDKYEKERFVNVYIRIIRDDKEKVFGEYDETAIQINFDGMLECGVPNENIANQFFEYATNNNVLDLFVSFDSLGMDTSRFLEKITKEITLREFVEMSKKISEETAERIIAIDIFNVRNFFEKIDWNPFNFKTFNVNTCHKSILKYVLDNHTELLKQVLENVNQENVLKWFCEMTVRKLFKIEYIENFPNDWKTERYHDRVLASYWIEYMRIEPPLSIYPSPMDYNLAGDWRRLFSIDPPMEMYDRRYYDYMLRNDGKKRPQNITAMYSYFSNSEFNKIIFISTDDILDKPARLRFIIPVSFDVVKEFLTEDIDISGICKFTRITNDDWTKITGGKDRIDVVAFSNVKNIYGEYSKMSELIEYFKSSIEVKFDITLNKDLTEFI